MAVRKQRRDITRTMARCNWHNAKDLGYVSWSDWAAAKAKAGHRQKKCPDCARFFFKEEWGDRPPRGRAWTTV